MYFQDFENTEIQDVQYSELLRFRILGILKILRFRIFSILKYWKSWVRASMIVFVCVLCWDRHWSDSYSLAGVCLSIARWFAFVRPAWFCLFTNYVDVAAWRVHGHASWSTLRTVSRRVGELQASDGCVKQVFQLYVDTVLNTLFIHMSYEFIRVDSVGGQVCSRRLISWRFVTCWSLVRSVYVVVALLYCKALFSLLHCW